MSFLLRVASQARTAMPDIPVARPKGLLSGLQSAVSPPIERAGPPAPAPMYQEPRPRPSPAPHAAPERANPVDAPPPAEPPPAISAPKVSGDDTPVVVERRASPPATAEESGSPTEPSLVTSPDAGRPEGAVPAADAEPASDPADPQPASRPVLEVAQPRDAPQTRLPSEPGPASLVEPPGLATQVPDDAGTTPGEPIDRRDRALRVEPAQQAGDGAPISEPEALAPAPADRPIEEGHSRPVEVLPVAQPLTLSPPLPSAERALQRPAAEAKPPLLQIDQIDVVVTDPTPMPAPARSALAAVSADRRYLRRL